MKKQTAKKILQRVEKTYDKIAEEFDQSRRSNWKEFELLTPYFKDKIKLADLGCGNGRLIDFIEEKKIKADYYGIDISEKLLEKAKKNHPQHKFKKAKLTKLPFQKKEIDLAVAIASFHHLPSKKLRIKSLKEIHRILKKNGIFFLTAWNLFQNKYKKYIWLSRLRSILSLGKYSPRDTFIPWGNSKIKRYYYAFKEKELEKLLKENGFEIIKKEQGNNFTFICKKK